MVVEAAALVVRRVLPESLAGSAAREVRAVRSLRRPTKTARTVARQRVDLRLRTEIKHSKNAPPRTSALPATRKRVRLTPVTARLTGALVTPVDPVAVVAIAGVVDVVVATVAVV